MPFVNEAWLDRCIRLAVGALVLAIGWLYPVEGLLGIACRILGWYPLITGVIGWSPLYAVMGWNTRRRSGSSH